MKIRGYGRALAIAAAALVVASCGGNNDPAAGDVGTVTETAAPDGLPAASSDALCSAYLEAGVQSGFVTADLTALGEAFDPATPPAVLVALETLQGFVSTLTDQSVGDEFTIDEAWGTIGGYVKPLCRPSWRLGAIGASSPLDTATAFSEALRASDREQLRSLGAANVFAAFESLVGGEVDLGAVTHLGFDIDIAERSAECIFHDGFVDDCTWID